MKVKNKIINYYSNIEIKLFLIVTIMYWHLYTILMEGFRKTGEMSQHFQNIYHKVL